MPAKSKAQFRLMKAAENDPIKPSVAAEFTSGNVRGRACKKLPEAKKAGGGACW
jgi:hypothetical protein